MMEAIRKANELLRRIAERTADAEALEARAEAEIAAVRAKYTGIGALREEIQALDREIKHLMQRQAGAIFGGRDLVRVEAGRLRRERQDKVRIPRDAVEKIEAAGWPEGIKVVKRVDRPTVEAWPEERLAAIGAERKTVDVYSYEVRRDG